MGSEGDLKPKNGWRLSSQVEVKVQAKEAKLTTWTFVAQVPHKVMVARFQFKHHVAPMLFARMIACITFSSIIYGGLLVS